MKKLELKHLAPYLPFGLKAKNCLNQVVEIKGLQYGNDAVNNKLWTFVEAKHGNYMTGYLYECEPILRPLSDLTKEIEHKGEKFVPIDELSKITSLEYTEDCELYEADYDGEMRETQVKYLSHCQVQLLHKWHFDTEGLIDAGLAIDINTLNK